MRLLLGFLALSFFSYPVVGLDLVFKLRGTALKTLSQTEIEKLLAPENLTVNEEKLSQNITYTGVLFKTLLEKIYGKNLDSGDEILFTCSDGYQPSVPLNRFLKHTSLLAFKRADNKKFEFPNREKDGAITQFGPAYLVWENIKDKKLATEGSEFWPYQLEVVDVIKFSDRFANLAPPEHSSQTVKDGFLAFRAQCMNCHTMNGQGGDRSIELNYPVSVTEYMKEHYLYQWLDNPRKIRFNSPMPPVNVAYPNRQQMIKDVIAYLKAMAKNKLAPLTK